MKRIVQHYSDGNGIYTYYLSERNPCGCGSNCFHYEQDVKTGEIYGVCNACGVDVYIPKEEHKKELLRYGIWKEKES